MILVNINNSEKARKPLDLKTAVQCSQKNACNTAVAYLRLIQSQRSTTPVLHVSTPFHGSDRTIAVQSPIRSNYMAPPSNIGERNDIRQPSFQLNLPELSIRDKMLLSSGLSIQSQERSGGAGTGVIILDVAGSPDIVFETLTRFHDYEKLIPTVRDVKIYSQSDVSNVSEFSISKFRLKMNIKHTILAEEHTIHFTLDETRPNLVLRQATGYWHVQCPADRPEGYSRVYFSATVSASRLLPTAVVDYAAGRALTRATSWMQPYFIGLRRLRQ
eukprot:gene10915-22782_t